VSEPYRAVVADRLGNELDEVPGTNLKFGWSLDAHGPESCTFDVPKASPKCSRQLLDPGRRRIHLYRGTADLPVWAGDLDTFSRSLGASVVSFTADGYFNRLGRRLITDDLSYSATDIVAIARALIAYTQAKTNGDLGITLDAVTSGTTLTQAYAATDLTKIADAITTLSGGDPGFDFEIVPYRVGPGVIGAAFHAYTPQKGIDTAVVIEVGKNVADYSYDADAATLSSDRWGMGSGSTGDTMVASAFDPAIAAAYGLLEDSANYSDVTDQTQLQGLVDADLATYDTISEQPQFTLSPEDVDVQLGAFMPGDTCRVRIIGEGPFVNPDGSLGSFEDVDARFRCTALSVSVSDAGVESQTPTFDSRLVA
jgi:hypothetical protein